MAVILFVAVLLVVGLGLLYYGLPRDTRLPYVFVVSTLIVGGLAYAYFASRALRVERPGSSVEIAPGP
jgi:hypothetical protein